MRYWRVFLRICLYIGRPHRFFPIGLFFEFFRFVVIGLFVAMARGDADRVFGLLGPESRRALSEGVGLDGDAERDAVIDRLAVRPGWSFIVDRSQRARRRYTGSMRRLLMLLTAAVLAFSTVDPESFQDVPVLAASGTPRSCTPCADARCVSCFRCVLRTGTSLSGLEEEGRGGRWEKSSPSSHIPGAPRPDPATLALPQIPFRWL